MKDSAIINVRFDADTLCLEWADGLSLNQPLTRYSRLQDASPQARAGFEVLEQGTSVSWPELGIKVEAVDWVWEHLCDAAMQRLHALDWDLERLTPVDQSIVALWRLEADGYNGGFLQFFCNWGDQTCTLALQALAAIGAHESHAVVSRQRQLIAPLEDHPQLETLWDIMQLLSDEQHEVISGELDEQLWSAMEEVPALAAWHFYRR